MIKSLNKWLYKMLKMALQESTIYQK